MPEEILYKAKNSKGFIFAALFQSFYMLGIAVAMNVFRIKDFSNVEPSLNNPLVWMPYLLLLLSILIVTVSIRSYFSNYICLTKEGILVKLNKNYKVVLYENIKLIKKYSADKNTYTLIEKKDCEKVLGPDIKDINELSRQIRIYYPEFTNREGIIQGYDSNIASSAVLALFFLIFTTYWAQQIIKLDIHSLAVQLLWGGVIFLYILGFSELIKLIFQIKTRYFSIETKMMVQAMKASEQQLEAETLEEFKEQEAEDIVTNYCPLCGSRLVDFKCQRCNVSLDNIYEVGKNYCINCGTKREGSELDCLRCGLSFNI